MNKILRRVAELSLEERRLKKEITDFYVGSFGDAEYIDTMICRARLAAFKQCKKAIVEELANEV